MYKVSPFTVLDPFVYDADNIENILEAYYIFSVDDVVTISAMEFDFPVEAKILSIDKQFGSIDIQYDKDIVNVKVSNITFMERL